MAALSLGGTDAFAGANEDLATACKAGDLERVQKALGAGADVNRAACWYQFYHGN